MPSEYNNGDRDVHRRKVYPATTSPYEAVLLSADYHMDV